MNPVETLLRRTIGLDAASIGSSSIERTLRLRMKILGLKDVPAYLAYVNTTPGEWEELLEAVVVTETWFFRDQSPFKAFIEIAQSDWLPQHQGVMRVLSVPCSTGEEPYSLAMALLDAGVAGDRFVIEAVDISARALERAQRGLYGKNSFRGNALEFRDRHFTLTDTGYQLSPAVRDCVRFQRGNLLEETMLPGRSQYDFIFCRNLLIYFDRATQRQTLLKLHRLLAAQGVLFVGPAELPLVSDNGFVPIGLPMSFACRKSDANPAAAGGQMETRAPVRKLSKPKPAVPLPTIPPPARRATNLRELARPDSALVRARALADAGKLAEAAALCEAHLKEQGPSPEAYYLLGLVNDAGADASAMDYYRKALYLEPNHYETLLQMALLLERNGDRLAAQTFKRRAERLLRQTKNET